MRGDDVSSEPTTIAGIGPSSTMFVALHGELALHPWRDPVAATSDAYSLFYARSSALGWLADAAEPEIGGVWGMNDAGQDPHAAAQSARRVWFQVALNDPIPAGRPVPVQAFLACAGDVVARMGMLHLEAVQLLLPVQDLRTRSGTDAVMNLLQASAWFADADPHRHTRVQVTVDSGQNPSMRLAAPHLFQRLHDIKQDMFACDAVSLTDDPLRLEPAIPDWLWNGPAQHRATFHGTLVEWSLDALGWVAAFFASASFHHGVRTPVLFTASRSDGSGARVE